MVKSEKALKKTGGWWRLVFERNDGLEEDRRRGSTREGDHGAGVGRELVLVPGISTRLV